MFADAINGSVGRRSRALNLAPNSPPQDLDSLSGDRKLHPQSAAFVRRLFEQAGLNASDYRPETIRRRLAACLRALNVPTIDQAEILLRQQPRLVIVALDCLLLGVTWFFRD